MSVATDRTMRQVRVSLGLKVSAILAVTLIVVGAVTISLVTNLMHAALLDEYRSKGVGIARGLAMSSASLIIRDDQTKIKAFVDEFSKTQGVAYTAVNDPSGQMISSSMGQDFPRELFAAVVGHEELTTEAEVNVHEITLAGLGSYLDISYPIMNGGLGRAHVGMDLALIQAHLSTLMHRVIIEFGIFMVLGVLIAYMFSRFLVRPLFDMLHTVREVSTGNLKGQAMVSTRDEFVLLGESVNSMIASLRKIVSSVRMASVQVNDASEEILATSRDQERGVTDQVQGLEEIAQTMNGLADTARAIANNADGLTKISEDMSTEVQRGQFALGASRTSVTQIVDENRIISDRIHKLFEQSEAIIAVIDIIDNISDRLDLLALNAALEGSRAGEVGKGFSLVAGEMRRLAENVSGSTKEIKGTIQEIHGLVRAALEAAKHGSETAEVGAQEMEKTVDVMSRIFSSIEKATLGARQITVITQQQLSSSQQIATAMRDISSISAQGLTAAREVTSAATDLANLSGQLQAQVSIFQIADGRAVSSTPEAAEARGTEPQT